MAPLSPLPHQGFPSKGVEAAGCFSPSEPAFSRPSPKTLEKKLSPMDEDITSHCETRKHTCVHAQLESPGKSH